LVTIEYPVRTPEQIGPLLAGFRNRSHLSQADLARQLGVGQQTISQLERNSSSATLERLMRALAAMNVELVLRTRLPQTTKASEGKPEETW